MQGEKLEVVDRPEMGEGPGAFGLAVEGVPVTDARADGGVLPTRLNAWSGLAASSQ